MLSLFSSTPKIIVRYDEAIEVTQAQYAVMTDKKSPFTGAIAHRHDEVAGKYYIRAWVKHPEWLQYIQKFLNR